MVFYVFAIAMAFLVSSTVGLGGSLIAVPVMIVLFGAKSGIAVAALLLASNNIFKVIAYRQTIPWKGALVLAALTMLGTLIGAHLLLSLPDIWILAAVLSSLIWSLASEMRSQATHAWQPTTPSTSKPWLAKLWALVAGLTSGVSGTSGPLKGLAVRQFAADRQHYAGAASLISLVGDVTKASVFAEAALLGQQEFKLLLFVLPLMPLCAFGGRWLNWRLGERGFNYAFWIVIVGYSLRLVSQF
ncbi:MAG: sulfite exporter TauE/SafE family protein [Spirulina sp. SIO3F2]|nr:sulfite exporter TauE/SafE family protein [Spirulina sp. SIO3F2]